MQNHHRSNTVQYNVCALWEHTIHNATLPIQKLFDHMPFDPSHIKEWLRTDTQGGLLFPGSYLDVENQDPKLRIQKCSPHPATTTTINVDITLYMFRRDFTYDEDSLLLQPFDPSWHPQTYERWRFMHEVYAEVVGSQCDSDPRCPRDGRNTFRRMMHAHFADFGLIFGKKIWFDFGLSDMMTSNDLMLEMLTTMFFAYIEEEDAPLPPPLFNAATTTGSAQRVCAKCMTFVARGGHLKRCPCQQVYYCSKECQRKDWKVHKVVCGMQALKL